MKLDILYRVNLTRAVVFALAALLIFLASIQVIWLPTVLVIVGVPVILLYCWWSNRRARQQRKESLPPELHEGMKDMAYMPTPQEIDRAIAELRCALDGKSITILNQPPNGATVECEECLVTEIYQIGNNAAESAHLLTHPERCHVRT